MLQVPNDRKRSRNRRDVEVAEPPRRLGEGVGGALGEYLSGVCGVRAVEQRGRGEQDVEEAVVLEAGVGGAVAHGVVQPGSAFERQIAVEAPGDRGGEFRLGGKGVAVVPPVRSFACAPVPASASRAPGWAAPHGTST